MHTAQACPARGLPQRDFATKSSLGIGVLLTEVSLKYTLENYVMNITRIVLSNFQILYLFNMKIIILDTFDS